MFRGDAPTGFAPRPASEPQRKKTVSEPTAVRPESPEGSGARNLEGIMECMLEAQREQMKMQTEILQSLKAQQPNPPVVQANNPGANADSSGSE